MPLLTASKVPDGFVEKTSQVNGIAMNYAVGGTGPTVVLLHGYPQTWYSWRKIMPALAERYTVIAPDLRGSGGSDAPESGYDKATLAEDVHQLLVALGLQEQVNVVGHDIGTMVAYAYAAAHRGSTRRLVLLEAPQVDETAYELSRFLCLLVDNIDRNIITLYYKHLCVNFFNKKINDNFF